MGSLIGHDRWGGSTDRFQVCVIGKGEQVSGKRDAGKFSAEAAQLVTVTVPPSMERLSSESSNNNTLQERGDPGKDGGPVLSLMIF